MGSSLSSPESPISPEKTFLVTGGNAGIGYVTAKKLAQLGGRVVITCRSEEKAKDAIERMQREHADEVVSGVPSKSSEVSTLNVLYMTLDLSSLKSVEEFVQEYKHRELPLDVLICNAGVLNEKRIITGDGFESHFQVNYLSHFLLTLHLLPLLKARGPGSRIVNVSSVAHTFVSLDFDNMQCEKYFSLTKNSPYGVSKLLQVMNMYVLAERVKSQGISVFCTHPGTVSSSLFKNTSGLLAFILNSLIYMGFFRAPEQGALTTLCAALDPMYDGKTSLYFSDCKVTESNALSKEEAKQERLWRYTLECLKDHLNDEILKEVGESISNISDVNHKYSEKT